MNNIIKTLKQMMNDRSQLLQELIGKASKLSVDLVSHKSFHPLIHPPNKFTLISPTVTDPRFFAF